jgi:hypothetical protein
VKYSKQINFVFVDVVVCCARMNSYPIVLALRIWELELACTCIFGTIVIMPWFFSSLLSFIAYMRWLLIWKQVLELIRLCVFLMIISVGLVTLELGVRYSRKIRIKFSHIFKCSPYWLLWLFLSGGL